MKEKFQLKNGIEVSIRQIKADDYEDVMAYLTEFSETPGAKFTYQYPGRPKKDKEKSIKAYENPDSLFVGAYDKGKLIALAQIGFVKPDHPWVGKNASFGISMLDAYQGQGLGYYLMGCLEKWARKKGVHRIEDCVRQKNKKGIALYLKCGFEIEGLARENAFIDGEWINTYYIAKILD